MNKNNQINNFLKIRTKQKLFLKPLNKSKFKTIKNMVIKKQLKYLPDKKKNQN